MGREHAVAAAPEYARILAEVPWLAGAIAGDADAPVLTGAGLAAALSDPGWVAARAAAGEAIFPMPGERGPRAHAQLWWYSLLGSLWRPAAAGILVAGAAPAADWAGWSMALREGFWTAFAAAGFTPVPAGPGGPPPRGPDPVAGYGERIAGILAPAIAALGEGAGVRPAPLWALVADEAAGAACGAGNELMEPRRGAAVGARLAAGVARAARAAGAAAPAPARFAEVTPDSVAELDPLAGGGEEPDWDARAALVRASCCMIYRSPVGEPCASCPRRARPEREAQWMARAL